MQQEIDNLNDDEAIVSQSELTPKVVLHGFNRRHKRLGKKIHDLIKYNVPDLKIVVVDEPIIARGKKIYKKGEEKQWRNK